MGTSEFVSDLKDCFLDVGGKIAFVRQKVVIFDKVFEVARRLVHMLNSFVDTILANILPWELEPIGSRSLQWHSEVTEIHFSEMPLPKVSDKSGVVMSLGHLHCVMLVVLSQFLHQL